MSAHVSAPPSLDLLRALPKTDLHVHLDGSLRLSTVRELAARYGLPYDFATDEDVRAVCQVDDKCDSLVDYLKVFDITLQLMQRREDITRIAFELAEDAHRENVRYNSTKPIGASSKSRASQKAEMPPSYQHVTYWKR